MIIEEKDLLHYGILRRSGRYPWGSGGEEAEATRHGDFLDWINDLKKRLGWSDAQIAESISTPDQKVSSKDIRELRTIARHQIKAQQIAQAQSLKDKGYSNVKIGERMGINESVVRTLLAPGAQDKADVLETTARILREQVEQKKYVDFGKGTENYLNVSDVRLNTAIALLKDEGYKVHYIKNTQVGTGKDTRMKVLTKGDVTSKEVWANRGEIKPIAGVLSDDGMRTAYGLVDPLSINPNRIAIRYKEDGGAKEDGVIYLRPGVDDLSLGGSAYAQVRIKVGDNHYMKGMAIYRNDLPDGVDILFNTNKSRSDDKLAALKEFERDKDGNIDPDNPFGSYIKKQLFRENPDGTRTATSAMNIVNEEGDWGRWSKSIASQVLSKQSPEFARKQLAATFDRRQTEFDEIMALTNPTVRRKLLQEFSDKTDAAAVHLKAAGINRQRWQVIIPVPGLADNEVYAPNFRNGERVVLIRYPHGGTFEIPELTVNTRSRAARSILGKQPLDAIGINDKVAERLSGADFDGDTVLVIPNNRNNIISTPALRQLKGFDPKSTYAPYEGMRTIDGGTYNATTGKVEYPNGRRNTNRKQTEMGDVSNLITDMTIKGASHDKIARAVRHSMVVIDSEKHHLDYKRSARDNGIAALKEEYQGGPRSGAATIISRAKSEVRVPERTPRLASRGGPIDKDTGRRVFEETGRTYITRTGQEAPSTTRVKRLELADDANTLSSGTPMERLYADHSNRLKAMANQARLEMINTPRASYSPSAAKTYAAEVASLNAKLDIAYRNKPLERQAQTYANAISRKKIEANPDLKNDLPTRKKIEYQALAEARNRVGAGNHRIDVTPQEWDAIQAGAISDSKLRSILDNANMESVRMLATPRTQLLMSPALTDRASQMLSQGYTRAEVADQLGVSLSTLDRAVTDTD